MVEKVPETAKWINGNWEEEHLAGKKVSNDFVARCDDRGGWITFVYLAQFSAFVRLKM